MKILALDPGNSTGWCFRQDNGKLQGGTLPEDHEKVAGLIIGLQPDLVVYENFKMYPGKAKSLYWNSFYPCEVIGVIKYICKVNRIPFVDQAPSIKKYAGPFQQDWEVLRNTKPKGWITEHVKDAYQHLRYYERNNLPNRKQSV